LQQIDNKIDYILKNLNDLKYDQNNYQYNFNFSNDLEHLYTLINDIEIMKNNIIKLNQYEINELVLKLDYIILNVFGEKDSDIVETTNIIRNILDRWLINKNEFTESIENNMNTDVYYTLAESIVEEKEIKFIYGGVKKYFDELLEEREKYNLKDEDLTSFFKSYLEKASDFYYDYLIDYDDLVIMIYLKKSK
jgi:hypothetical protein